MTSPLLFDRATESGTPTGGRSPAPRPAHRRTLWDVVGVVWVLSAAVLVLTPALLHGSALGPHDVLSTQGLGARPGATAHNLDTFDQILEFIPWTTLSWTQVHHGTLPLWNPYSALGTPLAFNWQSAPFSLPSLMGYLFPLRLAYTVGVLVTFMVGGTGAYVLGRVLRLGVLASTMAATAFELSGSFIGLSGWPAVSVVSWAGWLFAAVYLVLQGSHRLRHIAFLAVVLALSVYAGQIDMLVVLLLALAVFTVALLVQRLPRLGGSAPIARPSLDLLTSAVAGAALAAPLALPGLQLVTGSIRGTKGTNPVLPLADVWHLLLQGFDGLPMTSSHWFGASNYNETAAYVGVLVVALAALGVLRRSARPEVRSLGLVAVVTFALVFIGPVKDVLGQVTGGARVQWHRALLLLTFSLAMLAGFGIDVLVRHSGDRRVRRSLAATTAAVGIAVAALWMFGRGDLRPAFAHIRNESFVWPCIAVGAALAVLVLLALAHRRGSGITAQAGLRAGQWAAGILLVTETAFLLTAGAPIWSSSNTYFATTPAIVQVQRAVGTGVVGFGRKSCVLVPPYLGVPQEANIGYQLHEFNAYDPLLPRTLFTSWRRAAGQSASIPFPTSMYCPAVSSVSVARRFGIEYVLQLHGSAAMAGAVLERRVGDQDLYRIPGAAPATVSSLEPSGSFPGPDAPGSPERVSSPDPATWVVRTDAGDPSVLRLRLTDVPGWHATVDGRPARLFAFGGTMLQLKLPPGRHLVELHYWPSAFTAGIALAVACLAGFGLAAVRAVLRRRMSSTA